VGYRAFVEIQAHRLGLKGWVRNVGDDTVEAVAEGEKRRVEEFLMTVKQGPLASRVDESRVESEPATGEFSDFSVKRSQ
jgi:acylphosphatase